LCVGLVQISPDEFWKLTFAETLIKVRGYYLNLSYRSADFRNLFALTYNVNSKNKKTPRQLWPLEIDTAFKKTYTHDELKERNKFARELLKRKK
jgi:hypothetical protein